jgi:hypothetical protein
MVSVKKVLDALKEAGQISDWKWNKIAESWAEDGSLMVWSPSVFGEGVSVSDETYGKKSFLYFSCKTDEIAKAIATVIRSIGGKPGFDWRGSDNLQTFDLRVSYFKGHRWYE